MIHGSKFELHCRESPKVNAFTPNRFSNGLFVKSGTVVKSHKVVPEKSHKVVPNIETVMLDAIHKSLEDGNEQKHKFGREGSHP